MKHIKLFIIGIVFLIFIGSITCSCTKQQRVKSFGATETIELKNEKLINLTWKNDNLWVLTRPLLSTDSCETYTFKENSSFGILEGVLVIKETR